MAALWAISMNFAEMSGTPVPHLECGEPTLWSFPAGEFGKVLNCGECCLLDWVGFLRVCISSDIVGNGEPLYRKGSIG